MEKTLAYLRETLANYTEENEICSQIYQKLHRQQYRSEGDFVRDLSSEESSYLNKILPDEIYYANRGQDALRAYQLNEVYELLI